MQLSVQKLIEFERYLKTEEKSDATQEKYMRDARAFMAYAADLDISKELVVAWKKHLIEQGYAVRSINSMLASVNCLLVFLGLGEYKVKNIRMQRQTYCPEERELTKAEYLRLLEASKAKETLYLLLQTICSTGIRVSELQYFTVEAVQHGQVTINCKGKNRVILIPSQLRKRLLTFSKRKNIHTGAVFTGRNGKPLDRSCVWRQMKQLCATARVAATKVFPHNLRKLFARTFYAIEKDIAKLADILGHSSINTTRIYIMTTGIEHRRKIERLGLLL